MRWREHRLDGRQALGGRRQALAGPELSDGIHRPTHALDGAVRGVGDAHLLEAQWKPGADAHDDATGRHLVEGGASHGQDHRVAGEGVDGAERDPEGIVDPWLPDARGDGGHEADGVTLEVAVVDPDRVETGPLRPFGPLDDLVDLAAGGEPEPDPACQRFHRAALSIVSRRVRRAHGG